MANKALDSIPPLLIQQVSNTNQSQNPFMNRLVSIVGDTIAFTFQLPSYIKDPTTVQHSATR